MPVFEYTALDARGKTTSGIIDAEGAQAARQKLRTSGIFPVSIKETFEAAPKKESRAFALTPRLRRIKPVDIAMMTRQLATLLGAGFPLVSALDALVPQTKSHRFKKILAQIKNLIVEGNSFALALSKYPGAFSPLYINMPTWLVTQQPPKLKNLKNRLRLQQCRRLELVVFRSAHIL